MSTLRTQPDPQQPPAPADAKPAARARSRRPYQTLALLAQERSRIVGYYWARRCRKSTTAGDIYFAEMSKGPGRTVINCSASLLLGKESIGMTLSAMETAEALRAEADAVRSSIEGNAAGAQMRMKVANAATGKEYGATLTGEEFTELYQARAMEMRLYFDRTNYSRELVLAPSVQTFRSYRALVGFDEFGYMPANQAKDLINSADAMMRDTPDRRLLFFSNLSLSDHHPWYEMTLPRDLTEATEDDQFPANPKGHLYVGATGMLVHRVALKDAYAAGHKLYDNTGMALGYDVCATYGPLRSGWDVSYALNHKPGGASAVDIVAMATAQRRGVGACHFAAIDNDGQFRAALQVLAGLLGAGAVGIGFDVATTTSQTSNPSAITVRERVGVGVERFDRLKIIWKERRPQIVRERLAALLAVIAARPAGGPARRLCIDGSNERYFAEETQDILRGQVPVQIVIAGQTVSPRPAGYAERDGGVNYKTWLGDLEAAAVNEGRLALPAADYIRTDYRMVLKDGGRYICDPDATTGAHGDTFDSGKLAELALIAGSTRSMMVAPSQAAMERVANRRSREILVC